MQDIFLKTKKSDDNDEKGYSPLTPEINFDEDKGEFYLFGDIDAFMAKQFAYFLLRCCGNKIPDVVIYISSMGGSAVHAMSMVEMMRLCKTTGMRLTTCAMGGCASGAADVFLHGDIRLIGNYCFFLVHEVSIATEGTNVNNLADEIKSWKILTTDLMKETLSGTNIDYEFYLKHAKDRDWIISPADDVKYGLAHNFISTQKEVKNGRRKGTEKSSTRRKAS